MYEFSPLVIPLVVSAASTWALALVAWRRRGESRGAVPLAALLLLIGAWAVFYAAEIMGTTVAVKDLWERLIIASIALVGPAWLLLALEYSGREQYLSPAAILVIGLPALFTVLVVLSNGLHHLVWSEIELYRNRSFLATLPVRGPWFWVHAVFTYLYLFGGLALYGVTQARAPRVYRSQGWLMIGAAVLPMVGNLAHLAGLVPVPGLDLGPFTFTITGLIMALAVFRYQMLDLTPVAQRVILDNMREGVLVLDQHGRLLEINAAARGLLDVPASVHAGQGVAELGLPAGLGPDAPAEQELELGAPGDPRWVTVSATPLTDKKERPVGRVLVLRDTTERHRLRRLREDMQNMLVHDLRNPLSAIEMAMSFLDQSETLADGEREVVQLAQRNSARAVMLVTGILDVARLESGRLPLEQRPAPLKPLVDQVVDSMRPLSTQRAVAIQSYVPVDLPPAWVDERLVLRVLQNLLDNALKFAPDQSEVRISAGVQGDFLRVAIADQGPGIEPALQQQLFEKFVRGDHHRKGSGLGLAFCRLAVEAHGGEIGIESTGAKGTTLVLTLPRYSGQQALPRE